MAHTPFQYTLQARGLKDIKLGVNDDEDLITDQTPNK